MKAYFICFSVVSLLAVSASVAADETGTGWPITESMATTSAIDETGTGLPDDNTVSANAGDETGTGAGETGLFGYFLGMFE